MRTLVLFLALFLGATLTSRAQETLFSRVEGFGGFGGPVFKLTRAFDQTALAAGGRGGFIINLSKQHALSLGGGGYALSAEKTCCITGNPIDVQLGWGGFELEYIFMSPKLVHVSAQLLVGSGWVAYEEGTPLPDLDDAFFVVEPGANVLVNMTTFFRVGIGLAYRWINEDDVTLFGIEPAELSGVSGVLTLKFGKF